MWGRGTWWPRCFFSGRPSEHFRGAARVCDVGRAQRTGSSRRTGEWIDGFAERGEFAPRPPLKLVADRNHPYDSASNKSYKEIPKWDAKVDRFIAENLDLREYYEKPSKEELIRKLMLGKMQRSEYTNGRNAELRTWVEEHPEIKERISPCAGTATAFTCS